MRPSDAVVARIQSLCQERRITLNRLAHLSQTPQSTLNEIFSRRTQNPGVATLAKVCRGLGISLRTFFDDPLFDEVDFVQDQGEKG